MAKKRKMPDDMHRRIDAWSEEACEAADKFEVASQTMMMGVLPDSPGELKLYAARLEMAAHSAMAASVKCLMLVARLQENAEKLDA